LTQFRFHKCERDVRRVCAQFSLSCCWRQCVDVMWKRYFYQAKGKSVVLIRKMWNFSKCWPTCNFTYSHVGRCLRTVRTDLNSVFLLLGNTFLFLKDNTIILSMGLFLVICFTARRKSASRGPMEVESECGNICIVVYGKFRLRDPGIQRLSARWFQASLL
jgi:hypothetical protein